MRKIMRNALLASTFWGLCVACSGEKTDAKSLEGQWDIVEVNGEAVGEEAHPFIVFDMQKQRVHGNTSCNLFNASLTLDPSDCSAVQVGDAATTMMACPDMELESKVLQAMGHIRAVKQGEHADEMCLIDEEGTTVFRLARQ